LKPVTVERLLLSAGFWLLVVFVVDFLGVYFEKRLKASRAGKTFSLTGWVGVPLRWLAERREGAAGRQGKPVETPPEIESSPG
jgi:hypothetical protein